jgi:hypothetical protein
LPVALKYKIELLPSIFVITPLPTALGDIVESSKFSRITSSIFNEKY